MLVIRDEVGDVTHVAEQNGSTKFFRLKKLTKDEIASLLMENNPTEK